MYLVDTSVWVDFLQGADTEQRFEKWRKYFEGLCCYVSADSLASHVAAARLYQSCRRAGKTPRSSNDCLIACIAMEYGLVLLHNDRDFRIIAGAVPGLRLFHARA